MRRPQDDELRTIGRILAELDAVADQDRQVAVIDYVRERIQPTQQDQNDKERCDAYRNAMLRTLNQITVALVRIAAAIAAGKSGSTHQSPDTMEVPK